MKKIIVSIIALVAITMSVGAQTFKLYKGETLVGQYSKNQVDKVNIEATQEAVLNGHAYVEIGGLKWATMNLGASTIANSPSTCYGDYYAWGETEPYADVALSADNSGTVNFRTHATGKGKYGVKTQYYWGNYCGSAQFSEWTNPPYDSNNILKVTENDAARAAWGGTWRMPTSAEFQALYNACVNGSYDTSTNPSGASASVGKGVYWCTSYDGVTGVLFCDGTNRVFFPAAGFVITDFHDGGEQGNYRSSSLDTSLTDRAYLMFFNKANVRSNSTERCYGYSVRPVSE